MLTTPIIKIIKPFNSVSSYDLLFDVFGGDQVSANRVVIEKASDGSVMYDNKIDNFQFKHTIPPSTLVNGTQYRVKIKTYNSLNQESQYSDSILFYCFSEPIVNITNINDSLVQNSSYEFEGSYIQGEDELAQSFRFYLYNSNQVLLTSSKELFGDSLKYTFDNLEDNEHYFIELKVYTVNGIIATSSLIAFDVDYYKPLFHTSVVLENISEQASVKINAHILNIEGNIGSGIISYENNDWLNVKDGMVYFDRNHGYSLSGDWTMKIWCKDIDEDAKILIMEDDNNIKLELVYYKNRIHCFKEFNGVNVCHYASNEISYSDSQTVFIFIQSENDRIYLQSEMI